MDHIITFLRSELFLSLVGGFALGIAGLFLIKPAVADSGTGNRGVVVESESKL